jgi:electron transfer flavoprotein beta subunit
MKIVVGIKHVPDTESKITIGSDSRSIDEQGIKWIISPFDEYALEAALQIRDARGESEVIAVCAARGAAQPTLRQALAIGADRAILIEDGRFEKCDGLVRAQALAAVVQAEQADLVFLGKSGVGTDEGQTGPMLAELLDWPHASAVCRFEMTESGFTAERDVEGGREIQEGRMPAVISCEKGLNEPRYASLKGIMQAKKKPLEVKAPQDLGIEESSLAEPMLIWESLELPPARTGGVLIDGGPEEAAGKLAQMLRDEAKVI